MCGRLPPERTSQVYLPRPKQHGRLRLAARACRFALFWWSWMNSGQRRLRPYAGLIDASGGARQFGAAAGSIDSRPGSPGREPDLQFAPARVNVRADRLTAIHFPCQTRSGPTQGRNALGGSTGSEPGPKGLASLDRRSRSRWIGHTPYIAHQPVEP
jgi:hypothetical protein